ncbi:MAG: amidohydrolase [Chloroflexi bacterium]|nr:amidohydrolase [Chloroflexota bacterium]
MANAPVINTHTHMMRYGVDFSPKLGEFYVEKFHGSDCWHTGKPWTPQDFCVPVERLISDMDAAGIDKAVILGVGYLPWDSYDPEAGSYVQSMVQQYPDRLIGFYTADPIGGLPEVRRFERAVKEQGLRGLKILPSYNYVALNDRRIYPLYEAAQELQVPLLTHTGWSMLPKGKMLAYDHPLYLEDVAIDFPDLTLVIGHVGFAWADEAMHFMAKFENIYGDFAAWAETAPLWRIAQTWTWAKKLGVLDRFLWGSDYPYFDFESGKALFEKVRGYTERHDLDPYITVEDEESFFGGAAARLLKLEGAKEYGGARTAGCP